jgi:hypothetical protein
MGITKPRLFRLAGTLAVLAAFVFELGAGHKFGS